MPFPRFHPIVARWFSERIGEPTAAQRRGWAAIREGRHTLIAAPTGSGKTLAAFMTALDELVREGLAQPLPDEVRVLYVSPLKALSADIHKNLAEPRRGIRQLAETLGVPAPRVTAAVRTGDTPQAERAAMLRRPPHILVTTPESLYILLTAERSRRLLGTVRTVIVDEIHAVIGTRRGAHLALSLERLQQIAGRPPLRLGLSATQNPIEEVAHFLAPGGGCTIVDEGHRREIDLAIELPGSPLDAVMAHEVWTEYYDRLANLVRSHRTTLVFVNTRRMAERLARHLSDRLGEGAVAAHHGSLAKETRLDAETRLKAGSLQALVATASLELGIDIGHVDLACQIGSPHRIATLLQRVGRSGHTIAGTPKGRLFPVSRDDLIECAALVRSVRRGELDRIPSPDGPLDVLAQQVIAEAACSDYAEDDLFALVRRAWPYRHLTRERFDAVLAMAAEGFSTRRGRRGALLHRDEVNRRIRGRRGTRALAITSGGAIPDVADYRVVLDPGDTFIGTLNEDFAIESSAGDVFQLGNASWQILQVGPGVVRVADARGAPPTIPFWLGEAPARSDELSRAVSDLRTDVGRVLDLENDPGGARRPGDVGDGHSSARRLQAAEDWLSSDAGVGAAAAAQIAAYLSAGREALGALPTQDTLVAERFFDESGGMQLVLHAPFGSRVNRAWGLALRKRFCRQFNFELQAAATDDALLLSLGPQHAFPLADVFRYLHPATARDVLVQAVLDAPVFQTRWRWSTTIALAVPRNRHGRRVPPQLQRMLADDLLAAVFPDAAACLENIAGDRQIPDHPLVAQTVCDCLGEAMDFDGLAAVLSRIHSGDIRLIARDTPEPSPLAHEILNARPYAFLDDAPLEERRTQAVHARRASDPGSELAALDQAAIDRVRSEQRPDPRDADELHDALMTAGALLETDLAPTAREWLQDLAAARRACRAAGLWVAAERIPELLAVHPSAALVPQLTPPASRRGRTWARDEALAELVRGRMSIAGPVVPATLGVQLGVATPDIQAALLSLEGEGAVLRGRFSPHAADGGIEWCDRGLLARIHRYTIGRLRAEIEPVAPADFMRFLFRWQHASPGDRLTGIDGLRAALRTLDGFEAAAAAWERAILPARMDTYDPAALDMLCLTGEVGWACLAGRQTAIGAATPIALFLREHADALGAVRVAGDDAAASGVPPHQAEPAATALNEAALRTHDLLERIGAMFFRDMVAGSDLGEDVARQALIDLVGAGLATSDGFAGLRGILRRLRSDGASAAAPFAGRWSILAAGRWRMAQDTALETYARILLGRYGVVCRRVLTREAAGVPWRDLLRICRRLEARGEIRGGRFVTGFSGEQFALAEAIRAPARDATDAARRTPRGHQRSRPAEPGGNRRRGRARPRVRGDAPGVS